MMHLLGESNVAPSTQMYRQPPITVMLSRSATAGFPKTSSTLTGTAVEVNDIIRPVPGMESSRDDQAAVRINDLDAAAGVKVRHDHIPQQRCLARSALTENGHVLPGGHCCRSRLQSDRVLLCRARPP